MTARRPAEEEGISGRDDTRSVGPDDSLDAALEAIFDDLTEGATGRIVDVRVSRLGEFEIVRELGRGGMGVVFEARQSTLNRRVALKAISSALGLSAQAILRFQREAEAAGRLHQTNIVPIYYPGSDKGVHYYAMELIDGPSLEQVLHALRFEREGSTVSDSSEAMVRLPAWVSSLFGSLGSDDSSLESESPKNGSNSTRMNSGVLFYDTLAKMIAGVADALDHAHEQGVIHRDIKPANLLLSSDGRLSITDFGLARMLEQPGMTSSGEFLGSPLYMSPEQIAAGRATLDHRTDIYSLGATLYECLTCEPPHPGKGRDQVIANIMHKEPKPPRRSDPRIPKDLETICLKAMEREPDHRYQTARQMADDLRRFTERFTIAARRAGIVQRVKRLVQRHRLASVLILGVMIAGAAAGVFGWQYFTQEIVLQEERWARTQAIPEILRHVEEERYLAALELAREVKRRVPGEDALKLLWPQFSIETSVDSDPRGLEVSIRRWDREADAAWHVLGTTPIASVRLPRGVYHWRLRGSGRVDLVVLREVTSKPMEFQVGVIPEESPRMVFVPGGLTYTFMGGIAHAQTLPVSDFLIDRFEVTNREFQDFVDAGGYQVKSYWKHEFIDGEEHFGWEQAMARFVDSTNQPGPAVWSAGRYPEGREEYPVRGISWYEAAAYAEFVGKRLPSVYHWARAADLLESEHIIPISNFGSGGPAPVGSYLGVGAYGASDMAGNVKEWCWNGDESDWKFIFGGAWNESNYGFSYPATAPPWSRLESHGIRCVKVLPRGESTPRIDEPISRPSRDFNKEVPVSDEVFSYFLASFNYDFSPLNEEVLAVNEEKTFVHEKIEFDTAYGGRMKAHFYRPVNSSSPFQTAIYFPAVRAVYLKKFDETTPMPEIASLVENGRAVLYPIYMGTFDRVSSLRCVTPNKTSLYRKHLIAWSKDLGRAIDYLESRPDVDGEKLAFLGQGWGAMMGAILPAVESRLKVAVLVSGGFFTQRTTPDLDQVNFAPRVNIPTLMLNGRFSPYVPLKSVVEPMFRLLGCPESNKRLIVYESSLFIPPEDRDRETLAWLDKYLEPVNVHPNAQ